MMEACFLCLRRLRTSLLPSHLTQIEESNALLPLQIQVENVLGWRRLTGLQWMTSILAPNPKVST